MLYGNYYRPAICFVADIFLPTLLDITKSTEDHDD